MLLLEFLQFATNRDIMAFGTRKLAASTFGRLRGGTPKGIHGRLVNEPMGGYDGGEGVPTHGKRMTCDK